MEKNKSVGRIVSCIHRFTAINIHKKLEQYNIGPGQLHFLMILYHHEGINQECLVCHAKYGYKSSCPVCGESSN